MKTIKPYKSVFKEKQSLKEMAYVDTVNGNEIQVYTDHLPKHFHAVKKDEYEVRIKIPAGTVIDYKWQNNNKEISSKDLKAIKEWLGKPNKKNKKLTNLEAVKFSWNLLNP